MPIGTPPEGYEDLWRVPPAERGNYLLWASYRLSRAFWRLAVSYEYILRHGNDNRPKR